MIPREALSPAELFRATALAPAPVSFGLKTLSAEVALSSVLAVLVPEGVEGGLPNEKPTGFPNDPLPAPNDDLGALPNPKLPGEGGEAPKAKGDDLAGVVVDVPNAELPLDEAKAKGFEPLEEASLLPNKPGKKMFQSQGKSANMADSYCALDLQMKIPLMQQFPTSLA